MMQVIEVKSERREEWNIFIAQQPYFMLMQTWEVKFDLEDYIRSERTKREQ